MEEKKRPDVLMKMPFWATRDFKFLIIVAVMGLALVAVFVFEIAPLIQQRGGIAKVEKLKATDPNAWVPPKDGEGTREVRFDGVLARVKDSTPIAEHEEPYAHLLRSLNKANPESIAKEAKNVDYELYSKMPDALRGVSVKITALFLHSSPLRLAKAEEGREWIHRVYLGDVYGKAGPYVVDLLEPPPPVSKRDLVTTDAVFYKLGTYAGGQGMVQAPFLVGWNLRPYSERVAGGTLNTGFMIAAFAGLAVVGITILTVRIVKKSRSVVRISGLKA